MTEQNLKTVPGGLFFTFEGNEGTGKSTQARKTFEALKTLGYDVCLTREPGGSPLAEDLRSFVVNGEPERMDAMTELLIFTAARRDHIERVVKPALARGAIVICDRYVGSTIALQGAAGVPEKTILDIHELTIGLWPDATIHMSLSADESLERASERGVAENRMEKKGLDFHRKVSESFTHQARIYNWISIPAEGTIEEVHQRVKTAVLSRIRNAE